MRLVYTERALKSLEESLEFISPHVSFKTLEIIRNRILDRVDKLVKNPSSGKREEYLEHLGLNHRRIVESHYKIIYRVVGRTIYFPEKGKYIVSRIKITFEYIFSLKKIISLPVPICVTGFYEKILLYW